MENKITQLLEELTIEEKCRLTSGANVWSTEAIERLNIPSIEMVDGPHGVRKDPTGGMELAVANPATCFPPACAVAASWDCKSAEKMGEAIGLEAREQGVQIILGPGANIKRSPLCGRNFEYYSEDPVLSGDIAAAFIKGLQSTGVSASLKHFICNNQEFERMTINAQVDERALHEIYLTGFERAVKKGKPDTIMCSYNGLNGEKVAESHNLLCNILREKWGFEGFVVSDWGAVFDRGRSVMGGVDLAMPGGNVASDKQLLKMVKWGKVSKKELNRAVESILKIVFKTKENLPPVHAPNFDKNHLLAREIAAKSFVLLKNENHILPLSSTTTKKIAVLGQFAKTARYQGAGSSKINPTQLDSALDEISKIANKATVTYSDGYTEKGDSTDKLLKDASKTAKNADIALVFAGLPGSYESEGFDRKNIELPQGHIDLIQAVAKDQKNCIVILSNGAVVGMDQWIENVPAVAEGWLSGQAFGGAAADIIFGKVNPSGKLPVTIPYKLEDTPSYLSFPGEEENSRYAEGLFVGYRGFDKSKRKPLFPFGFGLSYTQFEYTDISLSKTDMLDSDTVAVSVKVKNSGKINGEEIVQLYVKDKESSLIRPEKELKGFDKIELAPGETGKVNFLLNQRDFAFYSAEHKKWIVESGEFEIQAGGSSTELPLKKTILVTASNPIRRKFTKMTLMKHWLNDPIAKKAIKPFLDDGMGAMIEGEKESSGDMQNMISDMPIYFFIAASQGALTEEALELFVAKANGEKSFGKALKAGIAQMKK